MTSRRMLGVVLGLLFGGALAGCGGRSGTPTGPKPPLFPGVQLRGAVLNPASADPGKAKASGLDPLVVLLNAQRGEWEAQRQGKVLFQIVTAEGAIAPESADVIAFRADQLGGLIDAGALAAIPDAAVRPPLSPDAGPPGNEGAKLATVEPLPDPLAYSDIVAVYRDTIGRYGGELKALPFGGSAMVLVYRRDVFDHPDLKAAAKEAGVALEPPRTYAQLDALARFLNGRDWSGDGKADHGIALAVQPGADGVAVATYLARAAALGQHPDHFAFLFDDETMAPRIAWPPFVEALSGLLGLLAAGPEGMAAFDAEAARGSYRAGEVALLIDRADRASRWTDPKTPLPTGVAALPGSEKVFDPVRKAWDAMDPPNRPSLLPRGGGWLVGVSSKATASRAAALDLVLYLAGADTAGHLLADRQFPLLPVRSSLLGGGLPDPRSAPGVDARGWGRALAGTLTAAKVVTDLRIPEAEGYEADLAAGIASAAATTPEASLKEVETRWNARTARLGVDRQLWHYRRSLNRRTLQGEPPARPETATQAPQNEGKSEESGF